MKYICLIIFTLSLHACRSDSPIPQWSIFEGEIRNSKQYNDPFRDVELLVEVTKPDGSVFSQYGFYDGDYGWKFRIMPDAPGRWKYKAAFSDGSDKTHGEFICISGNLTGPIETYKPNPLWLAFRGSGPVQVKSFHTGDRFFASNFSNEARTRFLDWIGAHEYNMLSIASHYLNRQQNGRGKGWDTPRLWPLDPAEYREMETILSDLEKRNIYVHPFAGFFGRAAEWPVDHADQELYIKYTLARIGAFRNIILNVGGPEPLLKPEEYQNGSMTRDDISRVALLTKKYDPFSHMLSVHNRTGNEKGGYERDPFINELWEDYSTLQGAKSTNLNDIYNFIIDSRKKIKPVFAHEVMWYGNMYHENLDTLNLRKKAVTLLMAGAFINFGDMNGNSSSGFSGCLDPDSAHIEAHEVLKTVWGIFEKLPYYELSPRKEIIDGAFCLSDGSSKHLIWIPGRDSVTLKIPLPVRGEWINTSTGILTGAEITEKTFIPPDNRGWLLWINR